MAHESALAQADVRLVGAEYALGHRITVVLDGGDGLLDERHFERPGGVAVARTHVAVLTGLRLRAAVVLILITAVEPLKISQLFEAAVRDGPRRLLRVVRLRGLRVLRRLSIHDREVDGVAASA